MNQNVESLSTRIQELGPAQLAQVEQLVTSLESDMRDIAFSRTAASMSEPVFAAIWSNPEDDVYDAL